MENTSENALQVEWLRHEMANYAMQQNYVPIVQRMTLHNRSESDLQQFTVQIKPDPAFAPIWSKNVDIVPAGRQVDLGPIHLELSGAYLAELTERLAGTLTLEITQGDQVLYQERSPLALLAYDQWGGLTSMPEMVAAFVMPNHPAVTKVLGEAAPLLERWSGTPSFDAYQSRNPNRVRGQAAAIFSAIQSHRPTYCVAPASFEEVGQRIRLPDTVLGSGMGNCLDLTLLYAACLEAVGLHPLIVVTKGHAFPGVWLIEETFSECVQDDVSLLTKRLAAGVHEISIAEATLMCAGSQASYRDAEQAAASRLADSDAFFGFIDVRRARGSAIRPIPVRIPTPDGWQIIQEQPAQSPADTTVPDELTIRERPAEVDSIPVTKQKQWERRLLDLTLRNTLLNFRMTKSSLPLLHSRLNELEDAIADGQEFQLLPKPEDWDEDQTLRSAELFQSLSQQHPLASLLQEEFHRKRLRANANSRELADKVTHLYRSARVSLEENGANTLFLALGLLQWYESPASEKPRYAPIVLIPAELVRRSSSAGFVLRMRDEEPQINITLLEMLRQDFGSQIGGLDPLPRDDKGIDLAGIFTTIRHVVMNLPRWDIIETAVLGLFSFSRFVMWHDIRSRADDLARNKVVASLMAGRLAWEPADAAFPDPGRLDEKVAPDRLLLPISADSSQISAISAANGDNSFVLHGPPGTGKSQTITNMIASALAAGKTVLFVAEKMAALSVVQSRLDQIGLGPFCLELHSNKSTKKAVLEQLRRTLETVRAASPEEWGLQAERVAASRNELNDYAASLHKPYGFGASLYESIARYGQVKSAPAGVAFEPAVVGSMTREQYTAWKDTANELRVAGEAAGHPSGHAWSDAACSAYTPAFRSQVEEALHAYTAQLLEVRQAYGDLGSGIGELPPQPTREDLLRLGELGEWLGAMPSAVAPGLLAAADPEAASVQAEAVARHGQVRDEVRAQLAVRFRAEALTFDAAPVLAEWRTAEMQWFLPKYLKQSRIAKMLKAMAVNGAAVQKKDAAESLALMVQYQAEAAFLKQAEPEAALLLGALWKQGEADWLAVDAAQAWTVKVHQALLRFGRDAASARQARNRLAELLAAGKEAYLKRHGEAIARFTSAIRTFVRLESRLSELLAADFAMMDKERAEEVWLEYRERKARQWAAAIDGLREWCSWRLVRDRASSTGLQSLVAAYEAGPLRHADVVPAFERAWWKAAIDYILAEDQRLASFSGRLFEEKIKGFQELAERFEKLTRQEIAARLSANIPPLNNQAASSSEAGILLRAIRSGGRGLSLRKLFEQIPNLLGRICPCMLMSPMSVAQYLDPKYAPFDLVVFDEASQLPTSEAVGAMARGHHVIVVGDPKQLPPTSFFTNAANDDADDAVVPEDLESILDDCLALGMPQEHLLWHYRSRHESLIAFSNRHFYENKLLTFPSPFELRSNVQWHPVEGYYDRGKTKQNRAEAEQVVAAISRRLRDPDPVAAKRSIGVVTFSSIQQTLIEDLLDDAFRRDGELEQLAASLHEPIFIKNLENVQGDERDVILFSVGYGPDQNGKVVLNFGPLNREGGWRRLNVAVSRARHEMHVFSTLRAEHLDVSRTRAHGVGMLRSFLEYAEKGLSALGAGAARTKTERPGIEAQIAESLAQEGYRADLHVGSSGYRIDVAVADPARPDTYLLAILCDGDSYTSGRTARDREVLREQVLGGLGWRIHRVWSMDWLDNPAKEIQRIKEAIAAAQAAGVAIAATAESGSPPPLQVEKDVDAEPGSLQAAGSLTGAGMDGPTGSRESPPDASVGSTASSLPATWRSAYRAAQLTGVSSQSPEDFYLPANTRLLREQIIQVVQEEGPISKSQLIRRVLHAWGVGRSGARIERHFDQVLHTMKLRTTIWDTLIFYWPQEADPAAYDVFRVPEGDQERRNAEDLPPEEIANAIREVLYSQISLPLEDLIRETVKMLGYSRTGSALDKAVRNGLRAAELRGYAEVGDNRVSERKG